MVQWPNNEKTALSVYDNNEKGQSGYYPVGISNMWHSGIHINTKENTPIYPLLDGKLVAYRIEEEYKGVALPEKITAKMFEILSSERKNYYKKEEVWGETIYVLQEEYKDNKELYSNNFVLLKHKVVLDGDGGKNIHFYTLYMNLAPTSFYKGQSWEKNFQNVNKNTLIAPFYVDRKYKCGKIRAIKYDGTVEGTSVTCIEIGDSIREIECSAGLEVYRQDGVGECIGTTNIPLLLRDSTIQDKYLNFVSQTDKECFLEIGKIGSADITYEPRTISTNYELLQEGSVLKIKNKTNPNEINTQKEATTEEKDEGIIVALTEVYEEGGYRVYVCEEVGDESVVATILSTEGADINIYHLDAFRLTIETQTLTTYIQETKKARVLKIKREGTEEERFPSLYENKGSGHYETLKERLDESMEFSIQEHVEKYYKDEDGEESDKNKIFPEVLAIETSTGEKRIVKMDDIQEVLFRKTTCADVLKKVILSQEENGQAEAVELTIDECIGYAAKCEKGVPYYDLALILDEELEGVGQEQVFNYFNGKIFDRLGSSDYIKGTSVSAVDMEDIETKEVSRIVESKISNGGDNVVYDTLVRIGETGRYYKRNYQISSDWKCVFQKATAGLFESEGNIFCRGGNIIRNLSVEAGVLEQLKNLFVGNYLSKDEIEMIYGKGTNLSDYEKVRSALRRFMCNHPVEWDKELYDNKPFLMDDSDFKRLKEVATATDIWEDALVKIFKNGKIFWFVHPIYFVNHLLREGYLNFNPYRGKVLETIFATGNDYKKVVAKSCFGFAPVKKYKSGKTGDSTRFPPKLQDRTNNEYFWGALSDVAGFSYGYFNKSKFHTGIDLAGNEGDPIISMITGVVWATTWEKSIEKKDTPNGGYGMLMIIKDLNKPLLYLISHLNKYKKNEGDIVYPGQTVALVGTTGNSEGPHLHLEVFQCDTIKKAEVLNATQNKTYETVISATPPDNEIEEPIENIGLAWASTFKQTDHRLNPLDHSKHIKEEN